MARYACLLVLPIIFLLLQFSIQVSDENEYRAMVVEYNFQKETMNNIQQYILIIEKAKKDKINLIVFPEATLTLGKGSDECIPDPGKRIIPYKDDIYKNYPALSNISKAAAENEMYVVVNLAEKSESTCGDSTSDIPYNTNVVFDKEGTVIAKYRKFNVYSEFTEKRPEKPEYVTFKTDFGATFGMFTCFDILFQQPALKLVDAGVQNFLFPNQWFGELPFLTAVQVQAGWSYSNRVNLLASGANNPKDGSTGTGIYIGQTFKSNIMAERDGTGTIWTKMPPSKALEYPVIPGEPEESPSVNKGLSLLEDPSLQLAKAVDLDLNDTKFNAIVSYDNFNCNFQIRYKKSEFDNAEGYKYKAVVYKGKRRFGGNFNLNVAYCALVLCIEDVCTKKPPNSNYPLIFDEIQLGSGADFDVEFFQFPTTLIWENDKYTSTLLNTMEFDQFTIEDVGAGNGTERNVIMRLTNGNVGNLITFGIYTRLFAPGEPYD